MALTSLTITELDNHIQKFLDQNYDFQEAVSWLKNQVLMPPTVYHHLDFTRVDGLRNLTLNEKIMLAVSTWYMPPEIRFSFNLTLEEYWGGEFEAAKEVLLLSKRTALGYLLVQDRFNEFDFFGNILNPKSRLFYRLFRKFKFHRINRQKRGFKKVKTCEYKDKGSRRPDHAPEPSYDSRKLLSIEDLDQRRLEKSEQIEKLFSEIEARLDTDISS